MQQVLGLVPDTESERLKRESEKKEKRRRRRKPQPVIMADLFHTTVMRVQTLREFSPPRKPPHLLA
jgi:hypothetical protein